MPFQDQNLQISIDSAERDPREPPAHPVINPFGSRVDPGRPDGLENDAPLPGLSPGDPARRGFPFDGCSLLVPEARLLSEYGRSGPGKQPYH